MRPIYATDGMKVGTIARILGVRRGTVQHWVSAYGAAKPKRKTGKGPGHPFVYYGHDLIRLRTFQILKRKKAMRVKEIKWILDEIEKDRKHGAELPYQSPFSGNAIYLVIITDERKSPILWKKLSGDTVFPGRYLETAQAIYIINLLKIRMGLSNGQGQG